MQSVVIVAPRAYEAELARRLEGFPQQPAADGWVLNEGDSNLYVARNDYVWDELEPEVLAEITRAIPNPVFYTVDFHDADFCSRVLLALVDDPELIVDNDYGLRLPGPEFARVLRSRPGWDWRRDARAGGVRP